MKKYGIKCERGVFIILDDGYQGSTRYVGWGSSDSFPSGAVPKVVILSATEFVSKPVYI